MKRLVSSLLTIAAILVIASTTSAQNLPDGDPRNAEFVRAFEQIVRDNPTITDFQKMPIGTSYRLADGSTDQLGEDDTNGIWGREFRKVYGISYADFLNGKMPTTPVTPDEATGGGENIAAAAQPEASFDWRWLIYASLALLGIYLVLRFIMPERHRHNLPFLGRWNPALSANPITSGPAMVPGGIRASDHQAVRDNTRAVAARSYADTHGGALPPMDQVRIVGDIVPGTMRGPWETRYNQASPWVPRRYNGERGFQALVSVNGGEPTLETWSLECGNDLRSGTRYRGGEFIPNAAAPAIPAQPPAPVTPLRPHVVGAAPDAAEGPMFSMVMGNHRYSTTATEIQITRNTEGKVTGVRANGFITVAEIPKAKKARATRPQAKTGTSD